MRVDPNLIRAGTEARSVHTGHYISGAGHLGLILWLLVGGSFAPAPEPFEVTEVAVISGEQFDALMEAARPPQTVTDVAMPTPPETPTEQAPAAARPEPRPVVAEPPQVTEPPKAETPPDVTQMVPPQEAEVTDEAPVIAPVPQETVVLAPDASSRPVPRPVDRVAPTPVAQPEPDTKVDDVVREQVKPEEVASPQPTEEVTATAPEEATTEIATEAKEKPSSAPVTSMRPKTRPAAPPQTPEQTQTAAAPKPRTDAVKDALAEALAEAGTAATPPSGGNGTAASGPPLTSGEKDALRVAVQQCWNVDVGGRSANVTVTVGVSLDEAGRVQQGTLRLLASEGGTGDAVEAAFQAARRAIIRCQKDGYPLPRDKYDQWREIEMTFNPEKMRIK